MPGWNGGKGFVFFVRFTCNLVSNFLRVETANIFVFRVNVHAFGQCKNDYRVYFEGIYDVIVILVCCYRFGTIGTYFTFMMVARCSVHSHNGQLLRTNASCEFTLKKKSSQQNVANLHLVLYF